MFYRSIRLFLRPAWPEDWQDIWQGIADEGITRNLATAPWPYTRDHARGFRVPAARSDLSRRSC